jgi:hypothetical protein
LIKRVSASSRVDLSTKYLPSFREDRVRIFVEIRRTLVEFGELVFEFADLLLASAPEKLHADRERGESAGDDC